MQFDTRSLWIYLYFPQLQLDCLESTHSQINFHTEKRKSVATAISTGQSHSCTDRPAVAIVDTHNNQLCQINKPAVQQGVKLGMGLASASLIYPDLRLHEYNDKIENQALSHIANQLYLFTSDIALAPPKAIVLRVQNMLSLYGGLQNYWQVIQQSLGQEGVRYIAASAYSIQAAKILALSHQNIMCEQRENIEKKLLTCPLSSSDIDSKDLLKLSRIGVKTVGEMKQLPLAEIANRVSRFSMNAINELMGKQAARVKFYQPEPSYHDYVELLYDISLSSKLIPVITSCVNKLSEFLLLRNALSLSIDIRFFQREHESIKHTFNSIRPIFKTQDWIDIITLQLESIAFSSPVYALSVECAHYETANIANDDMFSKKSTHVAALTLLSRLQSKLGKHSVHKLQFVPDFRPEALSHRHDITRKSPSSNAKSIFADRPGLLLKQPQALQMQVQVIQGPERIQTGWWDDQAINRDYYIGQSQDGQQVWIFKTPTKEWYLHGYFI